MIFTVSIHKNNQKQSMCVIFKICIIIIYVINIYITHFENLFEKNFVYTTNNYIIYHITLNKNNFNNLLRNSNTFQKSKIYYTLLCVQDDNFDVNTYFL